MAAPPTDLALPASLRLRLARPLGPVVQTDRLVAAIGDRPVAAVGDVVSITLQQLGVRPRLFVCDYRTKRGQPEPGYQAALGDWGDRGLAVSNPAGLLTRGAWLAVQDAFAQDPRVCTRIEVEGEEDLVGLAVFMEAPAGTAVVYGMPGEGVVVATADEGTRQEAAAILAEMVPA